MIQAGQPIGGSAKLKRRPRRPGAALLLRRYDDGDQAAGKGRFAPGA
jgi:hypothetical protein